ncbi:MAG: hypothetical protein HY658_01240 [Actinobacteria bacterium]|nr:hypothetical protein [Actinomycetota bacterium]
MTTADASARPLDREIRALFAGSMAMYLITVVVGILNGLDLVEFDHDTLMTHVHSGALGWISLGVFASTLRMFSEGDQVSAKQARLARGLAAYSPLAVAFLVAAFWSGVHWLRPVGGALTLAAILGVATWAIRQWKEGRRTVARLAMIAALVSLAVGAIVGVVLGLATAGAFELSEGMYAAHPATMIVGFLVVAGMAIGEWKLMPEQRTASSSRAGVAQVGCLFLAGIVLAVGALFDILPLIALNLPLEVAGIVIFLARLRKPLRAVRWTVRGSGRLFGLSVAFLAVNIGLIVYLIGAYADDFDAVPAWLIFALGHSMFIGVMTNALLGVLHDASGARRHVAAWADDVAFFGVNLGVTGFVVGLLLQEAVLKRSFAPIMGVAILVSLGALAVRLFAPAGRWPSSPRRGSRRGPPHTPRIPSRAGASWRSRS